jgi:hypothetical protein
MEKLIFRGAEIRYSDTRKDEGGVFVRIHMTADFTEVVREAMGWNVGTFSKGKLVPNDLCATHISLIPDEKSFRNHAIDLEITNMSDFEYFEVKDEDGNVSHEVRFIVRTPVEGAETKVANYMRFAGASAQLRVNYQVQDPLPLEQGTAKAPAGKATPAEAEEEELDTGCIQCNNLIPFADGDPKAHASGVACTARKDGEEDEEDEEDDDGAPPLAPAAAMRPRPTAKDKQKRTRPINEKKRLVRVQ